MKNQKIQGITLVALVITIIVLLILAGVSIAMLAGENGILIRSQEAIGKSHNSQIEENATLADYENKLAEKHVSSDRADAQTNNHVPLTYLAGLSYTSNSTQISPAPRTLADFKSNLTVSNTEYLTFDTTNNNLKVNKTGNYIFDFRGNAVWVSDGSFYGYLKINNTPLYFSTHYLDKSTLRGPFENIFNIYLYEGDTINIYIYNEGALKYYQIGMHIYAN